MSDGDKGSETCCVWSLLTCSYKRGEGSRCQGKGRLGQRMFGVDGVAVRTRNRTARTTRSSSRDRPVSSLDASGSPTRRGTTNRGSDAPS